MDPKFFRKYADLITEAEQAAGGLQGKRHGNYITFRLDDGDVDTANWQQLSKLTGKDYSDIFDQGSLAWAVVDASTGKLAEIIRDQFDAEVDDVWSCQDWTADPPHISIGRAKTPVGQAIMKGIMQVRQARDDAEYGDGDYDKAEQITAALEAKYGA
jgi:hypothetical protein